jgi:hypothetical protein
LFWILLSCQGNSVDTSVVDKDVPEVDEQQIISSEWEVEDVEFILLSAFELGLPSLPMIRDIYASYLQQRTYLCPTMENPNSTSWVGVWQSYCVNEIGYTYEGQALYSEEIFVDEFYFYQNMVASFLLTSLEETTFLGGGEFESLWQSQEEGFSWEARIGGTYRHSSSEDWLQNGEASLFWLVYGDERLEEIYLDGGVGYHFIEPEVYIYFEHVVLKNNEFTGRVLIRDPNSYWWEIIWVELDDGTETSSCSKAYFDNRLMGEICMTEDFRVLLDNWYEQMNIYVQQDVFEIQ